MKKFRCKLGDHRGETLAEGLVAILVAALAVTILCGYMTTSSRLVDRTEKQGKMWLQEKSYLELKYSIDAEEDMAVGEEQAVLEISVKRKGGSYHVVEKVPITVYRGGHMDSYELRDEE